MRADWWITVVPCAVLAVACTGSQGPAGPKGDPGEPGVQGPQGPPGTFSGTTSSPVTFSGGQDLFAASMAGLSPAVFGYSPNFGAGHLTCGAPTSLDVGTTVSGTNATYGEIIYTTHGAFNLSQSGGPGFTSCSNVCAGPLTFFLVSPSAQTIVLKGYMDNGPSKIYVDGTVQATVALTFNQGIDVPAGPFALSLVACSNDGFTTGFILTNQWIAAYNLAIDIDRTFHRNGK